MQTLILTVAVIGAAMLAMAVGVIFTGRRLKGSCGGVGGGDCLCEKTGRPKPRECQERDTLAKIGVPSGAE